MAKNVIETYRTLKLLNKYSDNDIAVGLHILNAAGIQTELNGEHLVLDFDVVDVKYIEKQRFKTDELLGNVLDELFKIRSFSTSNGKIVFKSFNKDKKVVGKKENKTKRLGYEKIIFLTEHYSKIKFHKKKIKLIYRKYSSVILFGQNDAMN
ncbi:MAG: hypothetical protein LBJ67_07350 [Planctomycetaceae bacterium]|jgi:hypothetical protein|nr:hypothetical protein [Planctomycetaceae bacterium]